VYALGEGHHGLLVALVSAIDVYNGLVRLRREYVRAAHGYAVRRSGTLLEDMALGGQRLVLVDENACILGDARVWLRRGRNGSYEVFSQHAGRMRVFGCCKLGFAATFSESFGGARLCATAAGCHHRSMGQLFVSSAL
jgi:hypothetical protein